MRFSHLGVFSLTTENAEKKTTPKICKITVVCSRTFSGQSKENGEREGEREREGGGVGGTESEKKKRKRFEYWA